MRLKGILTVERVTVALGATSKADALAELADLFVEGVTDVELDRDEVVRVFEERESLASTGVGSGVAIPHGRLSSVPSLVAAVGLSKAGVEFEAIDGRPAHIHVAVLGPERQTGEHLKALARFSKLLRNGIVRQKLLAAPDARAAFDLLIEEDERRS